MRKLVPLIVLSFFAFSLNAGVFDFLKKATPTPAPVKKARTYLKKGHTYSVSYIRKHHYVFALSLQNGMGGYRRILYKEYDCDECYDTMCDGDGQEYYIVGKLKTYHDASGTYIIIEGKELYFKEAPSTHYDE